jgi:hypothetical protein
MNASPTPSAPGQGIAGEASDVKSVPATLGDPIALPNPTRRATAVARTRNGHFYKPLPKEFRRDGFQYRQILREGDTAIYEQKWVGYAEPSVSYETIRIRRREGFRIGGRFVEPAEVYPRSELWGVDGFTFTNRNKAFAKLSEISLEEPAKTGREVN